MDIKQLNLAPGEWFVSNCADTPSEKNCKLVIMAPVDQKEDLIAAGIEHMVNTHGHDRNEAQKIMQEGGDETLHKITIS